MQILIWLTVGYIVHDAVQPTSVGQVLDKISLPKDLISG